MPIEITGQTTNQLSNTKDGTTLHVVKDDASRAASQQETGKSSTLDTVSFTDSAALLANVEKTLQDTPVVDTQRVEDIRQAIANGSFEIDTARVAEKLIGFESRLK